MKRFTVRPKIGTGRILRVGGGSESGEHVVIGRLAEAGPLVSVAHDLSQEHVVAIVGKRGSGKSYTVGSMLEGLCTPAGGSPVGISSGRRAAILFDTLGIFQWMDIPLASESGQGVVRQQYSVRKGWNLAETTIDVCIWRPNLGTELGRPTHHKEFTVRYSDFTAADWGYLLNLDILQDRMGQLLNDTYIKVTVEGWDDGVLHPSRVDWAIDDLLMCIRRDRELEANYQSETRRAVLQQLTTYARNPLFSAAGTDLHELLRPGVLSVIVMNKMSDELRFVLITTLVRKIMRARIEASELEKDLLIRGDLSKTERVHAEEALGRSIPPCWIAADEAQNFLPSERRTSAAEVLVRLVREGRNYGISFAITTQQPSAIDSRIMAQVDTLIAHKLTIQSDIEYVRHNLKGGLPEEVRYANSVLGFEALVRSLDVGQAVVSNTDAERAFILEVRPRLSVHGGF